MIVNIEVPEKVRYITEILQTIPVGFIPNVKQKHIAILLLAIRDLIQEDTISSRKIFFDKTIEDGYARYWKNLPKVTAGSAFIQMNEAEFFSLFLKNEINKVNLVWNRSNVNRYVHYGSLNPVLYEVLSDKNLNNFLYNYLRVRFIEDISVKSQSAASGNSTVVTSQSAEEYVMEFCTLDNYINFFSTVKSSNGNFFDIGQIKMYSNGLSSDFIEKKLKNNGVKSIFDVHDFAFLLCLEEKVEEAFSKGKIGVQTLYGLRQYMRFLSALCRSYDSKSKRK